MAESKEGPKSLLIRVKEKSEKAGLKLDIQKTKIMASSPITSWVIDGEKVETGRFSFPGLQNHCKWLLQPQNEKTLALWKKSYLPTKVHIVKAMVFPVVMYGYETWTIKKDECQRSDAFKL